MNKALTVRHPWAWAIMNGGKNVENRSRRTSHRGALYIHAAQAMDFDAFGNPRLAAAEDAYIARNTDGPFGKIRQIDLSTAGMVIGTVDLVDCHHADECEAKGKYCSSWAFPDAYHWVLDKARPLACPFPERGKLGIWNLGAVA